MKKNKQIYVFIAVLVLVFAGIIGARVWGTSQAGEYDEFAQYITDSGVTFYGAFWCDHCKSQKALFGNSEKLLPYVECSAADRRTQLQVCIDASVTGYPTWEFADGSRIAGEMTLEQLAEKTGFDLETKAPKVITGEPEVASSTDEKVNDIIITPQ